MRVLVSIFRNARDNVPSLRETDWSGFKKIVGDHRVLAGVSKVDAPALCPAEWAEGELRSKTGVCRVWFGALDFDKLTQAEMDAVLESADGLASVFYTTWSHPERQSKDGSWSFRLLVALSRPVEIEEWQSFWPRLHARLGGLADERCKDPSRIYFLPSAPTKEGCVVETVEGSPLDVDALLSGGAPLRSDTSAPSQAVGVEDLERMAGQLVRRKSPTSKAVAHAVRHALAGEPFAVKGNRDNSMFQIACAVADKWPAADPAAVAALFSKSLDAMAELSVVGDCPTVEDFVRKISKKQSDVRDENEKRQKKRQDAQASRILEAFDGERSEPYTEDELDAFAEAAGVDRVAFMRRWVVQAGSSYYLFKAGQYGPSLVDKELATTAERDLAPASTAGVTVWKVGDSGEPRAKTPQELVLQYGTTASKIVADLTAQRSRYELRGKVMVEAPCPLRDLDPRADESVSKWLLALGGHQAGKLQDWLACVTNLDEPCAAIYLDGEPNSGKTLFADAVARLWTTDGPTPLSEVVGSFNEALLNCPLVLADEVLPDILKRTEGTGELRQLIQARQLTLRRKFRPSATVRGAVRVVLTANNRHLLDTSEMLTPDDTAAVAERILYLHASAEAKRALEALGYEKVREFVSEDLVAKHVLWLRRTRNVVRQHRFLVSGTDSALHRSLTTSRGLPSAVCHWCVGYLLEPGKMDATGRLLVRVHGGELLVTARALAEHWEMYSTNVKPPASGRISRALAGICDSRKRQLIAGSGKPTNYWYVKTESLLAWVEDMGYATEDEITDALKKDTLVEKGPA